MSSWRSEKRRKASVRHEGLGEAHGARDVDGRGHARARGRHAAEAEGARLLVKEGVEAHEGKQLVVAGGNEALLLELLRKAEERAVVGVVEVVGRDLLEDAAEGLRALAQDAQLGGTQDLRRDGPVGHAAAAPHGVGRGEEGVAGGLALGVTPQLVHDGAELRLESAALKIAHG